METASRVSAPTEVDDRVFSFFMPRRYGCQTRATTAPLGMSRRVATPEASVLAA